jgi:hypothetical protein
MHVRKLATFFVAVGIAPMHARANNWPPAKGADMTNPANWPNDPDYRTDWNYWSFLPQAGRGDAAVPGADVLLGAAG